MAESGVHSTLSTIPWFHVNSRNNNLDIHISTQLFLKDTDPDENLSAKV